MRTRKSLSPILTDTNRLQRMQTNKRYLLTAHALRAVEHVVDHHDVCGRGRAGQVGHQVREDLEAELLRGSGPSEAVGYSAAEYPGSTP